MRLGDNEVTLREGDIFVWDNTQPMLFSVVERLHKISVAMPLQRLKDWRPNNWRTLPRWMPSGEPASEMLGAFIRSLARADHAAAHLQNDALIEAAVSMLVAPVELGESPATQRAAQLALVKERIARRLMDPNLSLGSIASTNRISLRYLHWLFEESETTAWRFITSERLRRCRQDLGNPSMRHRTITEIVFAWGFSDPAHFSRKFKLEFGISASDYRKDALGSC